MTIAQGSDQAPARQQRLCRSRKRTFDRPIELLKAFVNDMVLQVEFSAPNEQCLVFASEFNDDIGSSVAVLLLLCSPTAIGLAVRPVIIYPVKLSVRKWTLAHVLLKLAESIRALPRFADSDSSRAVAVIKLVAFVVTSAIHIEPRSIKRCSRTAMHPKAPARVQCMKAAATGSVASPKLTSPRMKNVPATARAYISVSSNVRQHGSLAVGLSRNVVSSRSSPATGFVRFDEIERVVSGDDVGHLRSS